MDLNNAAPINTSAVSAYISHVWIWFGTSSDFLASSEKFTPKCEPASLRAVWKDVYRFVFN